MANVKLSHVAKLARLHLDEKELAVFEPQVQNILQFVEKLAEVKIEGVEPTSHPFAVSDVFREDVVRPSLPIEPFLKHAPAGRANFFEVPKVIEDKS